MIERQFSTIEEKILSALPSIDFLWWAKFIDYFPIDRHFVLLQKMIKSERYTVLGYMCDRLLSVASSLDIPSVYINDIVILRQAAKRAKQQLSSSVMPHVWKDRHQLIVNELQNKTRLLLSAVIMRTENKD